MTLNYREMQVDDLPAAFAVRLSVRENQVTLAELEEDYGITPASLAQSMQSNVKGWLCEAEGGVVGFAMGDRSNGEVQVVAVRPDYEARGIGKALLARVVSWLTGEGHARIWLYANPDPKVRASGFYRKLGWRPSGEAKGEDVVLVLRGEGRRCEPQ